MPLIKFFNPAHHGGKAVGKGCFSRWHIPKISTIDKTLVLFVGGFFDSVSQVMFGCAQNYAAQQGRAAMQDVYYRGYGVPGYMGKLAVSYQKAGQRVILVGHSWGADAAIHGIVPQLIRPADFVATLDPVGRFPGKPRQKPANIESWVNVYVDYTKAVWLNRPNIIARIGGPWQHVDCADENHVVRPSQHFTANLEPHHASVDAMLALVHMPN